MPLSDAALSVLCEFLTAAIHLILFARRVYPEDSFERRRLFNVPVQLSRHPELREYIAGVVAGPASQAWAPWQKAVASDCDERRGSRPTAMGSAEPSHLRNAAPM